VVPAGGYQPGGKNSRAKLIINIFIYTFLLTLPVSDGSSIYNILSACLRKRNKQYKYSKYNGPTILANN
jgi:hypothetical protein